MIDRMVFDFLRRPKPHIIPEMLWQQATADFSFITALPEDSRHTLRKLAAQFIAGHEWSGAGGFVLNDAVIVGIAAQASLPVLHLSLDLYGPFSGIVVYPSGFIIPKSEVDEDGIVHEWVEEASGEAWPDGRVILSWEDAALPHEHSGYNVVIHEFAHKLDMADGQDDGIPVLDTRYHTGLSRLKFAQTLAQAYAIFKQAVAQSDPEDNNSAQVWGLDTYGASHPAEFFAVSMETLLTGCEPPPGHALTAWFALLRRYMRIPVSS
jgi:MtfA peptidase